MVKASRLQANANAQQVPNHWQSITKGLTSLLQTMRANYVSSVLDINGEYVKAGLADLELWCCEEYAGLTWDKIMHITQVMGFLL
ncbi:hypothetical protein SUGI_0250590 [Cryptomeria japonica]|nr:hypothetical protein SUGI_0250590 [Cryptomeria japonica]